MLTVEQEMIDLGPDTTGSYDKEWVFTDHNGHEHRYVESGSDHFPTLEWRESEPYYCEDCNDEHTDSWRVCAQCEEVIKPGWTAPTYMPITTPGPLHYLLDDQPITRDRANEIIAQVIAAKNDDARERVEKRKQRIVNHFVKHGLIPEDMSLDSIADAALVALDEKEQS